MHFTSTKIIHFTNLLIRVRHMDILGSVITVMSDSVNAAVWYLTFQYGIILVDEFSLFFSLLPYVEQGNYYADYIGAVGPKKFDSRYTMSLFVSPSDPTYPSEPSAFSSYAGNALFFGKHQAFRRITDGLSNTIAFGEHYGYNCGGTQFNEPES